MSARALRAEPEVRLPALGKLAVATLERVMPGLEGGTLVVRLPDGSTRRFGSGPEIVLNIRNAHFFRRLATRAKLALGESYTAGEWDANDLVAFFELLLRNAESARQRHPHVRRILEARPRANRRTGFLRARQNIRYHYDLGNDLFGLFLDETMTYSCALFENEDEPLEAAQLRKVRRVCEKLRLGPDDHVLEIGCGWGSFATVAAKEYGARVTGLTISAAQAELARARIYEAGLGSRVEIREQDYREVEGRFTKIASIEMLEAIGEKQFESFFAACDRLLAPGGWACIQTILVPDARWDRYRKTPDWIERYVFPGCLIPSLGALTQAMRATQLQVSNLEEIGTHYAETLRRWRARFHEQLADVARLGYDERFHRTWDFYLAFCEAAFRTRSLHDAQLVLERP
ncbi:MAG: class I SAM-dependent methyltransferase [Actinobacteria bacterium]|nr:class I SAM-dependent methyltransferase [Actinomycetota bacterium]